MSAKMSGFNQETFSNIQTIKAFDALSFYLDRLRELQKEYISMKLEFQRMSIVTSIIMSVTGLVVSYSSYGWGINHDSVPFLIRYSDRSIKLADFDGAISHQPYHICRKADGYHRYATGGLQSE